MRIAIVHDWLDTYRGGERVLELLLELYPDADVYTLFYSKNHLPQTITSRSILTPQRVPSFFSRFRKLLLPFLPTIIESIDLSGYDLVLSSSSCVAKGVVASPEATHVSYVHSPMRYVWDERFRYFQSLPSSFKAILYWPFHLVGGYLRTWDAVSSLRVDRFLANSSFVASRINTYYRREAFVLNPGVATEHFAKDVVPYNMRSAYYLVFGAHVFYKRHDFAVSLFSKHPEISLVVAGHGPELNNLKILAGANIRFVEDPSADEVNELYKNALGLIFPGIEDFGMVPVEAMAAGCPVFAYGVGGVRDSVEENVTGMFFTSYLEQDCWRQFELFRKHPWDSVKISSSVTRFSKSEFKRKFSAHVLQAVAEKQNRKTLSIESRSL